MNSTFESDIPNLFSRECFLQKMSSNSIIIKSALTEKQAEFHIPHPHSGVRYNRARGSLLVSVTPLPQSVRHWTPALHVEIPAAIYQHIKKKTKQGSVPNLK